MKVTTLAFALTLIAASAQSALVSQRHKPRIPESLRKTGRFDDYEDRIVGGEVAKPHEFKWQVSLFHKPILGAASHVCGGSIYNPSTIITAAHCCEAYANNWVIHAGEHDFTIDEGTEQTANVAEKIVHEGYSATHSYENDICLMKLETPLTITEFVTPAVLPQQGQEEDDGTVCIVSGWGATVEGGALTNTLRKVEVPVITDEKCRKEYDRESVQDSMICAGLDEGGKDSCQGDSGGPFMCNHQLTGIVSWGYGCARPGYPGVYTQVSYFVDWIVKNAQ